MTNLIEAADAAKTAYRAATLAVDADETNETLIKAEASAYTIWVAAEKLLIGALT